MFDNVTAIFSSFVIARTATYRTRAPSGSTTRSGEGAAARDLLAADEPDGDQWPTIVDVEAGRSRASTSPGLKL
jgi:hypothetical protein